MKAANQIKLQCIGTLCLAVLLVQGCSSFGAYNDSLHPTSYKKIEDPFTVEERGETGCTKIVVTSSDFNVNFKGVYTGGKAAGAATSAVAGGLYGCIASLEFPPVIVVFAPVGVVVGGICGAVQSEPKDKIEDTIVSTRHVIKNSHPEVHFRQQLCAQTDAGEAAATAFIISNGYEFDTDRTAVDQFDSILEIALTEIGTRPALYDPSLTKHDVVDVFIEVRVKLVRTRDSTTAYLAKYFYRSKPSDGKEFEVWTKDRGTLLCDEIRRGLFETAEAIIRDIFQTVEV